jgi:outer membrane beta-barrel protein
MNTASRLLFALGLVVATAGGVVGSKAEAQEVQITGPLAGAPAMRHGRLYRKGRVQLQPTVGFTINDEFSRSILAGLQFGYHFTDWIGLQLFFHYDVYPLDTDLTDQIKARGQSTEFNRLSLPSKEGFAKQIGHLNFITGAQATFIPLRGKLALFQAAFVDTDFYIFLGAALASVEERADVKNPAARACTDPALYRANPMVCESTQTQRSSRMQLAPTFGVGLSLYFTDYVAMTLEWRAFPFKWNTSGTDEGGTGKNRQPKSDGEFPDGQITESDRTFQFNQMFGLGFAFYLPAKSKLTE